jgi:hypothetical protein
MKQTFILWGFNSLCSPVWLKLSDWTAQGQKNREKDGWECQKLAPGLHPLDHKKTI